MKSEVKILELKYADKRFGEMDDEERKMAAAKMCILISVLTGWVMPSIQEFTEMLIEQLAKKMSEDYATLNYSEVEYAFRNRGIDVKDWGKQLNISLLDEILMPYLNSRYDISMQEEKISVQMSKEEINKQPEPMSDDEWEEWLNDIAKYEMTMIPNYSYEYLVRKERIILSAKEKHDYMARAIAYISGILDPLSRGGIDFKKMKDKGEFNADATGTLITISKKMVVYDYFNKINS